MDLQDQIDNFFKLSRLEEIEGSDRLQLGEIILKLEAVKNKDLLLVFDIPDTKPYGMGSWRGVYAELAIFTECLGNICIGEKQVQGGYDYYTEEDFGKEDPTVAEWLKIMKKCIGSTFQGWKGGYFTMSKNTPVSICKTQRDSSFWYSEDNSVDTFILDVDEMEDRVIFITGRE